MEPLKFTRPTLAFNDDLVHTPKFTLEKQIIEKNVTKQVGLRNSTVWGGALQVALRGKRQGDVWAGDG
jgi:hypothetical protein